MKPSLPSTVRFETECVQCPGDGVIRAKRAGIDWPKVSAFERQDRGCGCRQGKTR